jgi:phage terminase large subunit-like protein
MRGREGRGCTSWGIQGKKLYLLDVLRRRMEYPALKRAVRDQYALYHPSVVVIEDKVSGTQLIQELVGDGLHAVTCYQPRQDKVMRSRRCQRQRLSRQAKLRFAESMHAQTAMIENGFVHVPKTAPWLATYLHELTVFPNGRHDDQVPPGTSSRGRRHSCSTSSSTAAAPDRTPIWNLYRERAEELRSGEARASRPVRLRAPRGVGAVQLLSGARRNVAATAPSRCRNQMRDRCCWRPGFTPTRAVSCGTSFAAGIPPAASPITKSIPQLLALVVNRHPLAAHKVQHNNRNDLARD